MMWKAAEMFDDESSSNGETYRRMYLGDPNTPPGTEQRDGFIGTMKKDMRRKGGKHLAGVRSLRVPAASTNRIRVLMWGACTRCRTLTLLRRFSLRGCAAT
jgi:hypothetical protein